jgi:two-component system phosphate regulon sensor histidine kinase PhoR
LDGSPLEESSPAAMCRRVVACHLLFSLVALACLAVCAVAAGRSAALRSAQGRQVAHARSEVSAGWLEPLVSPWAALGAVLSVLALSAGAIVLWRSLRVVDQIERQLCQVAQAPRPDSQIGLVLGGGLAARGWNRLTEAVTQSAMQDGLHQRLGEALERYRRRGSDLLLAGLPDGVAVTDRQGRVTLLNPTASSLLTGGDAEQPLDGSMIYDRLSDTAAHSELAPLLAADAQERNVVVELSRYDPSGDVVLRVARHPLRDTGGQATGSHIWSIRDVTQQKLAEKMHNDFVNSATHELRTPMANIKAYAETLAEATHLDLEEQKEFCNTINAEVSRLSRLIDDLLSIESMEVGSLALDRQETDVERLLREKVEMVRPLMEKKDLAFHVSLPEKLPKMHLDKDKVALAVDNLLGNAAKYTPAGGEVSLRVDVDEHALQIQVQDTGVGIAAEEASKVFDKFFRSSDPRVRDEKGTGLGLAMVREIVHLHGGEVNVQSRLNEGSTFSITLPMG